MKNLTKPMGRISTLSLLLAVGCSGPVDGSGDLEQEDVAAQTSELRNGTLYDGNPTGIWNGVVKVEFLDPSGTWLLCSGQVVSAQTILTAGHCITDAGVVGNPVSMYVRASRPAPGGGWRTVMPKTWAYVKYNPAFNRFDPTDCPLLRAKSSAPSREVKPTDTTASGSGTFPSPCASSAIAASSGASQATTLSRPFKSGGRTSCSLKGKFAQAAMVSIAVWGFLKRAIATSSAGAGTGVKSAASSLATGTALTTGAALGGEAGAGVPQPSSTADAAPRNPLYETQREATFERSFNIGATLHALERDTK